MPTVLLFGEYADLVTEIGNAAADIVARRIRSELLSLTTNQETLMSKMDDLVVASQNVSNEAAEHRAVVDEAIALIQSGVGVDDPRLTAVIDQLGSTAASLDLATTDLAAASATPDPEEPPVDPEDPPVDPEDPPVDPEFPPEEPPAP